jgi:PAS domain S-box-containing protein
MPLTPGTRRPLPKSSTRPLLAGLLMMLLLMGIGMGIGIYQLRYMAAMLDQVVQEDDASREIINTMLRTSRNRTLTLIEAINTEDVFERDEKLLEFDRMASRFRQAQERLLGFDMTPEEKSALDLQRYLLKELVGHLDRVVDLTRQDDLSAAQSLLDRMAIPTQSRMLDALLQWVEMHELHHGQLVKQLQQQQQQVVGLMIGFALVSLLVGMLVTGVVYRWNRRLIARFVENESHLRSALAELGLRQKAMDAHSIVSVADATGRITHVNDKLCEVSGYRREELVGANHSIVNSGFHPPKFFEEMWETVSNGHIWRGEVKNRAKNGQSYWVETTIVPMLDEHGLPTSYIAVRTEITKIMEMEEALRQTNAVLESKVIERTQELEQAKQQVEQELFERVRTQTALQASYDELKRLHRQLQDTQQNLMQSEKLAAVGQLAAGMAHEINNPIGFVASNLTMLARYQETFAAILASYRQLEAGLDDDARATIVAQRQTADLDFLLEDIPALLKESRAGMERVRRIVQDLRDFSRVDSVAQWQEVDINHNLETTLNLLGKQINQGISIQREYGQLPLVECSPAELNQVFMNLLNNALQAIQGNGNITLRSMQEGDQVWVEIEDTGEGISDEVRPHIFDPFFTTRPVGQGAGLGLSMAYGIIQKHGGQISVISRTGKGSVFRVSLPLRQNDGTTSGENEVADGIDDNQTTTAA